MKKRFYYYLLISIFSSVIWLWKTPKTLAAEKISFRYNLLEFSLPCQSLEIYAKTGKIDRNLGFYLKFIEDQDAKKLQKILAHPIKIDSVRLYRFLNTSVGQQILKTLGELIQPSFTQNGFYALRSALILAASEPDGLTLINFLHHFPSETMYINGENSLKFINTFSKLIKHSNVAIAEIKEQATIAAQKGVKINFKQYPDLRKSGDFSWKKENLVFHDSKRDRIFSAELYRPQTPNSIPLIVISPGLGANGNNFAYLAKHLASYGFGVITVSHSGSDRAQMEKFLKGINREIMEAQEFVNRPIDISFLLDELDKIESNKSIDNGSLNLEQVGVIGHSFGGYAALALAGAELNLSYLEQHCEGESKQKKLYNFSLLIQCIALKLENNHEYQLADSRVKAVFAINPTISSVFGQEGLSKVNIPTTLVSGTKDFVTPALIEQIIPFTWLEQAEKHLLLIEKGGHSYTTEGSYKENKNVSKTNFQAQIYKDYFQAMTLAFMQNYLTDNDDYQMFLNSSYAYFISHNLLKLHFINSLNNQELKYFLTVNN
ncbi:MAG: alpha/beta hydrolase [Xenococcaceae cyanobacterium MO_188.B19]|nr:alpha/beta hydrolase [Xenococcaceae cyanobacterium MO_188.B19]